MYSMEEDAEKLKDKGNVSFKDGNWEEAVRLYSKAINLISDSESRNLSIYLKNRAAAYLKLDDFESALADCVRCLEIVPNDPKALFRRCQALEYLKRYEEAYRDATQIFKDDPSNKAVQPILKRLHQIVQERALQRAQTDSKIENMMSITFNITEDMEKRTSAMNNLLVLSREHSAAEIMIQTSVVQKIKKMLKVEKNQEINITSIRVIGELCKQNSKHTKLILNEVGIPWFIEILDSNDQQQVCISVK